MSHLLMLVTSVFIHSILGGNEIESNCDLLTLDDIPFFACTFATVSFELTVLKLGLLMLHVGHEIHTIFKIHSV